VARAPGLAELDPLRMVQVLNHAEQRRNIQAVAELLRKMDLAGHDPLLLYNFQAVLFRALYRAQQADADISRALGRLADGKGPDWMGRHDAATLTYLAPAWTPACVQNSREPADWELERVVARRVVRQLQDIGDGFAWRVHRFDRRVIVALADHPPVGPIVGKAGLGYEIGRIVERFRESGEFSLFHDLTTVLRHHDLTEVHADGYRELREIKTRLTPSAVAKASKQRRQAEAALAAATGTASLGNDGPRLLRSDSQLRTHVRELSSVMVVAQRDGYVVTRVHDRLVGMLYFPTLAAPAYDPEELYGRYRARMDAALDRHLPAAATRLHARIGFTEARDAFFAPYSIYPLPAAQRAALICDVAMVETLMDPDIVCRGFHDLGLQARCLLGPGSPPDADVFEVHDGRTRLTVHARAVSQLLFEFVQIPCFVRAFAANLGHSSPNGRAILTFSNEQRAWR